MTERKTKDAGMQAEIKRLNKVVQALMNRAERNAGMQGSDYNLFQTRITLEGQVRRRTAELEAALLENQKFTRALHESEGHYRAFFLGSSVPMLLIDPADGHIVDANAAAAKYYGYTLSQLRAMNIAQINTLTREEVAQEMAAAAEAKKNHFNFRHRLANGEVRDVEVHSGAVNLKDHRLLYSIVHDITERLNAEKIVKEQFYFIEQLIDAIPNPMFYKNTQGNYLGCNKAFEQLMGSKREEIVGKSVYDLSPKELADRYYASDKALLDSPGIQSYEAKVQSADGVKDVLFYKATFNKSDGRLGGLVGVILDITERKKMELQLAEREALFHAIFDQADSGIELIDPDTLRFVEVNPAACRMLGYTRKEMLQMHLEDTQVDMDHAALMASLQRTEAAGGSVFENRHRCKNGDILDVEVNAHVLEIAGKRLIVALWRDITGQKRAQEEIRFKNTILQTQQETSPDAVLVVNENGMIVSYNRRFIELWHVPPQLISGGEEEPVLNSVVEQVAEPEAFLERVLYLYAHNEEKSREELRLKNGQTIEWYSAPAIGTDGKYYGRVWYFRDISERKQAEENLAAREREFRTLAENSPDNIARYDRAGRILYANPALELTLGVGAERFLGMTPLESLPGELFDTYQKTLLEVAATGERASFEQIVPVAGGRTHIHAIQMVPELGQDGVPVGVLAVGHDISESKWAEESLRITASVFENSQEAIVITDADNRFIDVNPAFTRITGYSRDEAMGKRPEILNSGRQNKAFYERMWQSLKEKRAWRGEIMNRRKSGEIYSELLSIAAICDDKGRLQRYVGVFSDISYIKEHETELSRIAHYDALTGVPNRLLMVDRLDQIMAASKRSGKYGAMMFLDLDNFKPLNDMHGHGMGDLLLREVARRISSCVREMDTVARYGGDEFVIVLSEMDADKGSSAEQAAMVAEKIRNALAEPYVLARKPAEGEEARVEHHCTASIGVVLFLGHENGREDILKHADMAMYQAKDAGRNRVSFYNGAS